MSSTREWSDEEAAQHEERLQTLLADDARAFNPDPSVCDPTLNPITADDCRDLRDGLEGEVSVSAVVDDFTQSRCTLREHARGRCSHDPDVVGAPVRHTKPTEAPANGHWERVAPEEVSD